MESSTLEYALFLCRGHSSHSNNVPSDKDSQIFVLDEIGTPDFEDQIRCSSHLCGDARNHARIVFLNTHAGVFDSDLRDTYDLFREHWAIDMRDIAVLSSQRISSYHSRVLTVGGQPCFDICYNLYEFLSYVANESSPLNSSLDVQKDDMTDITIQHQYEPLYFRYNLSTGQTTYILVDARQDLRDLLVKLADNLPSSSSTRLHPLALQTVLLSNVLKSRTAEIDTLAKRLLWIENELHKGTLFEISDTRNFTKYIRLLHRMSRNLITLEHSNQRDASNVANLLRDHGRLWKLMKRHKSSSTAAISNPFIDIRSHEYVRDNLLSLQGFCSDRGRRIANLQQRTQDFVMLLYNLITGHDSAINLQIAAQNANIAREAKQDSTSMKVIAGVTMFYLPATFVCGLFGTNFVALNTNDSTPTFVVSELWWIYPAFAIPLTVATIFTFVLWKRWREGNKQLEMKTGTGVGLPRRESSSLGLRGARSSSRWDEGTSV